MVLIGGWRNTWEGAQQIIKTLSATLSSSALGFSSLFFGGSRRKEIHVLSIKSINNLFWVMIQAQDAKYFFSGKEISPSCGAADFLPMGLCLSVHIPPIPDGPPSPLFAHIAQPSAFRNRSGKLPKELMSRFVFWVGPESLVGWEEWGECEKKALGNSPVKQEKPRLAVKTKSAGAESKSEIQSRGKG